MLTRLFLFAFVSTSCSTSPTSEEYFISDEDSITLLSMVKQRERAMIERDIKGVTEQFDAKATFINGGGFYYNGLTEIKDFHNSMFTNDSLTYTYKTGNVTITSVRPDVAVIYYPWQQQWTMKNIQSDTLNEIGLMTIIATKTSKQWKWKAVTNQRTKDFFEDLQTHKQKAIQ